MQENFHPWIWRIHSPRQGHSMQAVPGKIHSNSLLTSTNADSSQCHCGKLFKKKSSLNTHKSTHSTECFACHCGAIFKCEQYLKNHQRRKHVEEVEDDLGSLRLAKRPCLVTPSSTANTVKINQEPLMDKEDSHFDPTELLKMQLSHEEA